MLILKQMVRKMYKTDGPLVQEGIISSNRALQTTILTIQSSINSLLFEFCLNTLTSFTLLSNKQPSSSLLSFLLSSSILHQNQQTIKMFISTIIPAALLVASAIAGPIAVRDDDSQKRICPQLKVADGGCIRYVKGFDVTGVVTEVDLTFPLIQDECDCIQQCLDRPTTCAAYVWKFSTPASVQSGHRTCTLYSQFNLPADVTIEIDTNSQLNKNINAAELVAMGNNPQPGAPVPQAFKDANLNTTADPDAVSGEVWQLAGGKTVC